MIQWHHLLRFHVKFGLLKMEGVLKLIVTAFSLFILFVTAAWAGVLSGNELKPLAAKWNGYLDYLEYSDNKTRTRLKTSFDCKEIEAAMKVSCAVQYKEPNGKLVDDTTSFSIAPDGNSMIVDGETWTVMKATTGRKGLEIVLEADTTDNNQPAHVRKTIRIDADILTYTKQVKQGPDVYIKRNEYTLTRVPQ